MQEKLFGYINGLPVTLFTVKNNNGFEVSCMNYGCVITKVLATDRTGQYENVVLGYDTLEEYDHNPKYLGAVVGRVAGRIRGDSFCIGEDIYNLQKTIKIIIYMEVSMDLVIQYGMLLCWKETKILQLSLPI